MSHSDKDLFYFRDFVMRQAPSGQRVNTDSCVFGALIGEGLKPTKILDIGSGTGVLALMLAQRFPAAHITAIEPETSIAEVAQDNFSRSPWSERINIQVLRAQELSPQVHGSFDFVLCNPPYFQNSMLSIDRQRAVARHNSDLSPDELFESMKRMMTADGTAWVSFPEDSATLWLQHAAAVGLKPVTQIVVKDHPEARPHMTIMGWSVAGRGEVTSEVIHYRTSPKGSLSPWMFAFRERWYPAKYNAQFYL